MLKANKTQKKICLLFGIAALLLCLFTITAFAVTNTYTLNGKFYESDNDQHEIASQYSVTSFSFGKKGIGSCGVNGSVKGQTTINGVTAFAVSDTLTFQYSYDGAYQTKDKESWNIISDDGKTVNGISLPKKIDSGVLIIQKSYDGRTWINAIDPVCDFFESKKVDRTNLYSISEDDLKLGTYFRVIVAYEMGRKTGEIPGSVFPPRLPSDVYEYRFCTEVYEFFAYSASDSIVLRDLMSGEEIHNGATVQSGFIIDKNGSGNTVEYKKNGSSVTVNEMTTVCDAGTYTIVSSDPSGAQYTYRVTISEGLKITRLSPVVYENKKGDNYTMENRVYGYSSMGVPSHTLLTIGHNSNIPITVSSHNGTNAYGITGSEVSLFLRLQNNDAIAKNGWEILADSWGKKSSQTICDVQTGQVDTGALIIQTSSDGTKWANVELERYANGLFTTDFEMHYGTLGDVLIYTPDGNALLNGLYIRVIYAYETKQASSKTDLRCIEAYEFYLCSNELDAVTFHNLSVEGQMSEVCAEYDDVQADILKHAETMLSGAYTVSGFKIDTSLNPTVTYTVKKNGSTVAIPSSHEFTATGRYEISLISAVNSRKTVTIYVDRMSQEESLEYYFGDAFLTGKRIYSDGEYAVYEGGLTSYHINPVDENHLPISGEITNTTTGETISIEATRDGKEAILTTPGAYIATLTTNPTFNDGVASGDCKVFTFRFEIIAEGTAPGPVVNQRSLTEYAGTCVSDSYPVYYALTYQSASTGYITLAFATKEDALAYAYEYEKGMVEQQSDGTYRYTGSFIVSQKEKYNSAWDLTDAVYFFAEQAIQTGYFDLSNEFTVLTLRDSVIDSTPNLRTLELARSVTIFAPGQKTELTSIEALPIISVKPYCYLTPGASGVISRGTNDFQFVKDQYGCDSSKVTITDCNGKEYVIAYNQGVGGQLAAKNCPSGVVTITETTIYGDTATYQAIYIASGDNVSELTLNCHSTTGETKTVFTKADDGVSIEAEAFSIADFTDALDPYALVVISDAHNEYFYSADMTATGVWSDPGDYQVKVVNRLGNGFTVNVKVIESDYATIRFTGEGSDEVQDILTMYGARNVMLPVLSRYGYNLVGFEDETGILYSDNIATIAFRGSVVLDAVWQAKQYTVTLQAPDGTAVNTLIMDFGKEYELPMPELDNGLRVTGWSLNGSVLESNLITLNSEGDITLIALTEQNDSKSDTAELYPTMEKKNHTWIVLAAVFVVVAIGVVVSIYVIQKNGKKRGLNQDKKENAGGLENEQ